MIDVTADESRGLLYVVTCEEQHWMVAPIKGGDGQYRELGPLLTPYAMTKHAVVGLSLSLRAEAAAYGVGVTVVCPGVVDTPILDKNGPDDLPASALLAGHVREYFRHYQPRFYSADRLAHDIARGIDRNAALVIAPTPARVAWYLYRYVPFVANRMAKGQLAWTRATFAAKPAETVTHGAEVKPHG